MHETLDLHFTTTIKRWKQILLWCCLPLPLSSRDGTTGKPACLAPSFHMVTSSGCVPLWLSSNYGLNLVISLAHVCLLEPVLRSSQLSVINTKSVWIISCFNSSSWGSGFLCVFVVVLYCLVLPYTKSIFCSFRYVWGHCRNVPDNIAKSQRGIFTRRGAPPIELSTSYADFIAGPNSQSTENLKMSRLNSSSLFHRHLISIFLLSSLERADQEDTAVKDHFQKTITWTSGTEKAMPGKAPVHIHMVCESCSAWHFYEGYVYVPFIFILLVLIAVSCTLLLCMETTCWPDAVPAVLCHMALLSSDRNLLLPDHNSWKCSALSGIMTRLTSTGTE